MQPILQIIFTTQEDGQFLGNYIFRPEMIASKKVLIDFCLTALEGRFSIDTIENPLHLPITLNELPKLVKLSCCIYYAENLPSGYKIPAWYIENKGKIYFPENIESSNY